ncbi:DUF2026 family protein [Xanthomonas sp. NCPPB 2632]|uniref:DUF2026 family protein n=1 Tax=Xanthomonas sp. NCPPB 2632 TaxID=3240912 RepID=UPI003510F985
MKLLPMQLPIKDYERAFRVMHAVLNGVGSTPEKSCVFFAMVGSYVLNRYCGVAASAVAGTALYRLDDNDDRVAFVGGMRDGSPYSDESNFHMWVQTKSHIIDFQAPLFREAFADQVTTFTIPRLMFQRGMNEDCNGAFKRAGDFAHYPNPELSEKLINENLGRSDMVDLLQLCGNWFQRSPRPIAPRIPLISNDGINKVIPLSPIRLTAAWGR